MIVLEIRQTFYHEHQNSRSSCLDLYLATHGSPRTYVLIQWFSALTEHQNRLKGFSKQSAAGLHLRISDSVVGGQPWKCVFVEVPRWGCCCSGNPTLRTSAVVCILSLKSHWLIKALWALATSRFGITTHQSLHLPGWVMFVPMLVYPS